MQRQLAVGTDCRICLVDAGTQGAIYLLEEDRIAVGAAMELDGIAERLGIEWVAPSIGFMRRIQIETLAED